MISLAEKINAAIHYNSDGDVDVEAIVDVIVEELDDIEKRLSDIERDAEESFEKCARRTTAQRVREDNERI